MQNLNFIESSVVFRRATALFNQIQQRVAEEPRKWDANELAKALVRLATYADIFTDLVGEMNSRILSGESDEAPKLLTAAQMLTNHAGLLKTAIQQGNTILQKAYQEDSEAQRVSAGQAVSHTMGEAPPEGIAPARAATARN